MTCRQATKAALKRSSVDETFFLVEWRDEDSHSVISARDLQDPTCALNLKKGADVNIVERRTKRVYTAIVLDSGTKAFVLERQQLLEKKQQGQQEQQGLPPQTLRGKKRPASANVKEAKKVAKRNTTKNSKIKNREKQLQADNDEILSAIQPLSSPPAIQPLSSPPAIQPVSSPPAVQPLSSPPAVQPLSSPPAAQPISSPPAVQSLSSPPTVQPLSFPPAIQPLSSPPAVQPLSSPPAVQPLSSPPAVQPLSSPPAVQSLSSPPTVQPLSSPPAIQPISSPPAVQQLSSPPAIQPLSSPPAVQPLSSPPVIQLVPSPPAIQPISFPPAVQQLSSPSAVQPLSSPPAVQPLSSPPAVQPVSSPPAVQPLSSPPAVQPLSSPPAVQPLSSQPPVLPIQLQNQSICPSSPRSALEFGDMCNVSPPFMPSPPGFVPVAGRYSAFEDDRSIYSRSSTPQSSLYFGDSEIDHKLGYKLEYKLEELKCDLFGKLGEMQQEFATLRKEIMGKKRSKKVMQNDSATNEQGESLAPMCSVSTFASTASVQSSHDATCGEEGVWLGDPASNIQEGRKIWIPGVSPINILQAEAVSPSPKKLVLNLMSAIFTTQELSTSNCTQPRTGGVKLLDQKKIHGIRLHIRYKYPTSPDEEAKRWTNLLQNQMNGKCRTHRDAALRKLKNEQV